jgi:hypothetical protein
MGVVLRFYRKFLPIQDTTGGPRGGVSVQDRLPQRPRAAVVEVLDPEGRPLGLPHNDVQQDTEEHRTQQQRPQLRQLPSPGAARSAFGMRSPESFLVVRLMLSAHIGFLLASGPSLAAAEVVLHYTCQRLDERRSRHVLGPRDLFANGYPPDCFLLALPLGNDGGHVGLDHTHLCLRINRRRACPAVGGCMGDLDACKG